MKKLKLCKSKALSDEKQQKISNFFIKNSLKSASQKTSEENIVKLFEVEDKNQGLISPSSNQCSKCLKEYFKSGCFCNSVVLQGKCTDEITTNENNTSPSKGERLIKSKTNKENCVSVVKNSPDVIPPTPPIATKRKRVEHLNEQSAKRKFSFSESNSVGKKGYSLCDNVNIANPQSKNKINSDCSTDKSSSPTCVLDVDADAQLLNLRNPFRKLTTNVKKDQHFDTKKDKYAKSGCFEAVVLAEASQMTVSTMRHNLVSNTEATNCDDEIQKRLQSGTSKRIGETTKETLLETVHTRAICNGPEVNIRGISQRSIEDGNCDKRVQQNLKTGTNKIIKKNDENKESRADIACSRDISTSSGLDTNIKETSHVKDQNSDSIVQNVLQTKSSERMKNNEESPSETASTIGKTSSSGADMNIKEIPQIEDDKCEDRVQNILQIVSSDIIKETEQEDNPIIKAQDSILRNKSATGKKETVLSSSDFPSPAPASECEQIKAELNVEDELCDSSFFDNFNFDDDDDVYKNPVSLENGVRCEVVSVEHFTVESSREVVLGLKPCSTCVLRGSWADAGGVLRVGDVVSVSARPLPGPGHAGCWLVDDECGLLVVHPDVLVSGTAVVGSLFCQRRSVLSDMYRGVDSDSPVMALGSYLHQLLQEVLKRRVTSLEGIKHVLDSFISSRHFIFSLYSSGMSLEKTKETLLEFVPKIHAFLQKYIISVGGQVDGASGWDHKESWRGRVTDVADIEENIWTSRLGLKGRVDVTVHTSVGTQSKVMPLELKTGRASFSAEHRGQVILYTMMMTELGHRVDSGLLLYLRECVMKEVQVGPVERRDLILLRNQLVTQLQASREVAVTDGLVAAPPLPPPIHHSACAKCPYLTLCSAALRMSKCGVSVSSLPDGHPLLQLTVSSTQHVTEAHMVYVFHWSGLLRLEHTDSQLNSPALHDIWTLTPQVRQKRGTCVPNVRLSGTVTEVTAGSYEHVFEWREVAAGSLVEGDYVIVSSDTRAAVAAGPIRHIAANQITLYLERDLSSQKKETIWHLDKYESQSGLTFNLTNLGCLLDDTEQALRLRSCVIDLELPQFKAKLSSRVLQASVDLVAALNDQQRRAIFRALAAQHYILIKGMPGTGKTATLVALIQLAVRLGLSVLITSHTHSAVDNVLLRLKGLVDFLRLGASHKIHPELASYGETGQTFSSPDQLRDFYNSKSVVGVTCLGASHPLLARRQFDLCLVDEATQVLQPTVLRSLFSAHKFILIGDPDQLPPLVKTHKAKELGLAQSLFVRLDRPAVTSELSQQYRMNSRLTELANTLTYAGKLQCASECVATATLRLPHSLEGVPHWIGRALSPSLTHSVVFVGTGDVATEAASCINQTEADLVVKLLAALNKAGLPDDRVGVMAPYRAQVELLRQCSCDLGSSVEVNTVDQYQGRDKDIILYSCTRSRTPAGVGDILGDKNRLTVAVTRARHKLIFIGNISLLRGYKLFNTVIDSLTDDCIVSPFDDKST